MALGESLVVDHRQPQQKIRAFQGSICCHEVSVWGHIINLGLSRTSFTVYYSLLSTLNQCTQSPPLLRPAHSHPSLNLHTSVTFSTSSFFLCDSACLLIVVAFLFVINTPLASVPSPDPSLRSRSCACSAGGSWDGAPTCSTGGGTGWGGAAEHGGEAPQRADVEVRSSLPHPLKKCQTTRRPFGEGLFSLSVAQHVGYSRKSLLVGKRD